MCVLLCGCKRMDGNVVGWFVPLFVTVVTKYAVLSLSEMRYLVAHSSNHVYIHRKATEKKLI